VYHLNGVANNLLKELRKVDDKLLLVEVHLVESRAYTALGNLKKARGSLTAARTTTSGIYTPPKLQAALDLESGILHAADDRDFKTAYSYFYEAFEQFETNGDEQRARIALKLMLLSKIVLNAPDDVPFVEIARAVSRRSVDEFAAILRADRDAFADNDEFVLRELERVYDALLEANLLKVLEPYSRVRLADVARLMRMQQADVEQRLSRMILDQKVSGVIDQGNGTLTLFAPERADATYEKAIEIVTSMNKIVDMLFEKSKKLN
jgi:26S proteasome regulatory subunit N6